MMPKLFRNKYRIPPARLKNWDYSQDGYYYVTICTKNRKKFFGEVKNKKMVLSPIGKIVAEEWKKTAKIRKNVKLDFWVVMPNHLHGIVIVDNRKVETHDSRVETHCNASLRYQNRFGPQSNNLSSIIRGFKGATTKRIHNAGFHDFAWQPRFWDHIVDTDEAHGNIQDYILANPANWEKDKENVKSGD
jgi:putative transposase